MGYSLRKTADFQNCLISQVFGVLSSRFFHRTTVVVLYNGISHVFDIFNFWQNWPFCKGYSLCKMADFKNILISRIFGVLYSSFFAQNNCAVLVEWFFRMFLAFSIFDHNWTFWKGFAWAIAFARWPIFKFVLFLEYLVFFRAVFCTEQLCCRCRIVFRRFLAFLMFHLNWPFCKGYSLCMGYSLCKMADFQICLISRIFGVFSSRFLHRTTVLFL